MWSATAQSDVEPIPVMPETVDIVQGAVLYAENCAACHGANLEGQPDWQVPGDDGVLPAPPHDATGHTWHHTDALLFNYTALGGREMMARLGVEFNSGMPGMADTLSEQEIWDILAFIQSTWPERQRVGQAERTQAELSAQGEN
ncbi:cytochrome c [Gymnodinialimonas ceratoperidinii]|uniref:Cytochrome c n=2 Tax=Gymnodinialimonas ceratoperidinii TaxID=2856823 RepID=A0A8F6YEN1_9RHOB|nr:cytochrome c [Gymnodinialimonas ceratoperidinii]